MTRITTILVSLLICFSANAQKHTLGISKLTINPSVRKNVVNNNNTLAMDRVTEALNEQILNAVQETRRFELISLNTSDQAAMTETSDYNKITGDLGTFDEKAVKYILTTQINDFQDFTKNTKMPGAGKEIELRKVRMGCMAKILDVQKRSILETANFQIEEKDLKQNAANIDMSSGRESDAVLLKLATKMSKKIANRVLDVLTPAKIIAKTGEFITINRGDGTNIERGQTWEIFHVGEDLIDPETGENLGKQEIPVGKAQIIRVTPKFTQARVIEDFGVAKGHVVRPELKD